MTNINYQTSIKEAFMANSKVRLPRDFLPNIDKKSNP